VGTTTNNACDEGNTTACCKNERRDNGGHCDCGGLGGCVDWYYHLLSGIQRQKEHPGIGNLCGREGAG